MLDSLVFGAYNKQSTGGNMVNMELSKKVQKCVHCKNDFTPNPTIYGSVYSVCPHCACVQMPRFHPLRLKHGFLFLRGHPALQNPTMVQVKACIKWLGKKQII